MEIDTIKTTKKAPVEDEQYMVKIAIIADSKRQKVLNRKREYVNEHPAICTVCRPAKDFMLDYLTKYKRYEIAQLADPEVTGFQRPQWKNLPPELQERLLKTLERHQATHDAGDSGRVKRSELEKNTGYLGKNRITKARRIS